MKMNKRAVSVLCTFCFLLPCCEKILSPQKPLLILEFKALPDVSEFFKPFTQPLHQNKIATFCNKPIAFDEETHYSLNFFPAAKTNLSCCWWEKLKIEKEFFIWNSRVKSLKSEPRLSATQFFKRSYKISHNPGL